MRTWGWATLAHWTAGDRRFFLENRLCNGCQDKRIKSVEAACSRCSVTKRRGRPPGVKETRPREKRVGGVACQPPIPAPKIGKRNAIAPSTRVASSVLHHTLMMGAAPAKRARVDTCVASTEDLRAPSVAREGGKDKVVKLEHQLHKVTVTSLPTTTNTHGAVHGGHSSSQHRAFDMPPSSQPSGIQQHGLTNYSQLQGSWNSVCHHDASLANDQFARMPASSASSQFHDRSGPIPTQHDQVGVLSSQAALYGTYDNYGMYAPSRTFYNQPATSVAMTEPVAAHRGPLLKMVHSNMAHSTVYTQPYQEYNNTYTFKPSLVQGYDFNGSMPMMATSAVARHTDYSSHYNAVQSTQPVAEDVFASSSYSGISLWPEHEPDPSWTGAAASAGGYSENPLPSNTMPSVNSSSMMNHGVCAEGGGMGGSMGGGQPAGGRMASCMQSVSVDPGTLKSLSVDAAALSSQGSRSAYNLQSISASDVDALMNNWTSAHSALVNSSNLSGISCDAGAGAMGSFASASMPWVGVGGMESMANWGDPTCNADPMPLLGPQIK